MAWSIGIIDFKFKSDVESSGRCASSYMEKYLVRTDSGTFPTPQEITTAVGIVRGSPYPTDPHAICYGVEIGPGPVMTRAPFLCFTVTVNWSTAATKADQIDDDPTTMRVKWGIRPNFQGRYITKDRHDKLITNTAGQPFDGGVPVDVKLGVVTAKRNVIAAGYDVNAVLTYSGRWNSEPFMGAPVGTVQVVIYSDEVYEGDFHYWAESYEFKYDPQGIQPKIASAGFYQRVAGGGCVQRILNSDLNDGSCTSGPNDDDPVQEPEPLDEDGFVVPYANRPNDCAFVEIDYYESYDFANFNLGTPGV